MTHSPSPLSLNLPPISGFKSGLTQTTDSVLADPASRFASVISNIIAAITIFAGIFFLVYFLISAFTWVTGGDPQQLEKAKKQMSSALIGLSLVILLIPITYLISRLTGLDIINFADLLKQFNLQSPAN